MSIHSLEKCPDFIGRGQRIHLVDEETPRQSVMTCFVLSRFDPNTRRPDRFAKPFERSLLRIPILEYIRPIILAISVSPFQAVRRWPCVCSRSPPLYAGLDKIHYLVKIVSLSDFIPTISLSSTSSGLMLFSILNLCCTRRIPNTDFLL
jgi:hypothetical protein